MCETAVEYAASYQIWWTVSKKFQMYAFPTVEIVYVKQGSEKGNICLKPVEWLCESSAVFTMK